MNRRQFLRLGGYLTLGSLLAACDSSGGSDSDAGGNETVIIVGAGMAGLAAGRALQDNGYTVILLEGRDRIGGRTFTSRQWADAPVDLGASWIHGVKKNPLTKIADDLSLTRYPTDYDNGVLYDYDGTELDDSTVTEIEDTVDGLLADAMDAADPDAEEDYPISEAVARQLQGEDLSTTEQRYLDFYLNSLIEHEFAADINELSTYNGDEGEEYKGGDVIFANGYEGIVNYLAKGLDIRLQQKVTQIDTSSGEVRVVTTAGTFAGARVIVTLPLGVLQKGNISFTPALPKKKQEGISALGMGLLNKTILRFDTVFWANEYEFLSYAATSKGHWAEWLNLAYYTQQPLLMAFNAATYGRAIESMSDKAIVADAMTVLRTIYGNRVPEPTAWQITRWASDPFAYGAYSFSKVGATSDSRQAIADPVGERLFFAGEATSIDFPATVHGAYLSGVRAATEVMDL